MKFLSKIFFLFICAFLLSCVMDSRFPFILVQNASNGKIKIDCLYNARFSQYKEDVKDSVWLNSKIVNRYDSTIYRLGYSVDSLRCNVSFDEKQRIDTVLFFGRDFLDTLSEDYFVTIR